MKMIAENEVATQQELQQLLENAGISATKATLSRDIRELKINKDISDSGVNCYISPAMGAAPEYNSIFSQAVVSLDYAMNTVVVKCRSGLANAACAVLDEQQLGYVVGTIAGDDTIFVLTRTENHAAELIGLLKKMMKKR